MGVVSRIVRCDVERACIDGRAGFVDRAQIQLRMFGPATNRLQRSGRRLESISHHLAIEDQVKTSGLNRINGDVSAGSRGDRERSSTIAEPASRTRCVPVGIPSNVNEPVASVMAVRPLSVTDTPTSGSPPFVATTWPVSTLEAAGVGDGRRREGRTFGGAGACGGNQEVARHQSCTRRRRHSRCGRPIARSRRAAIVLTRAQRTPALMERPRLPQFSRRPGVILMLRRNRRPISGGMTCGETGDRTSGDCSCDQTIGCWSGRCSPWTELRTSSQSV